MGSHQSTGKTKTEKPEAQRPENNFKCTSSLAAGMKSACHWMFVCCSKDFWVSNFQLGMRRPQQMQDPAAKLSNEDKFRLWGKYTNSVTEECHPPARGPTWGLGTADVHSVRFRTISGSSSVPICIKYRRSDVHLDLGWYTRD